jgi:hypothetical protein
MRSNVLLCIAILLDFDSRNAMANGLQHQQLRTPATSDFKEILVGK